MNRFSWHLPDEAATNAWAAGLAACLPQQFFFVALEGGLGAGKTHTVRAVLRALGETGPVRSPTYTLMEDYRPAGRRILHLDLYRLADASELEFLGLRDCYGQALQMFIEWPGRAAAELPPPDLKISLSINPLGGRVASAEALSECARRCLEQWCRKTP